MRRVERPAGAVMVEAAMFAAVAGAVAMVAFMVLGERGFISGVLFGGVAAVVVFAIMFLLLRGTLEPPRGPGNIRPSDTPLTRETAGPAPAASASKPASAKASSKPAPAKPAASKPADAPPAAPAANAGDTAEKKPELLSAPRGGQADDLKRIRGVGPKLETVLNEVGIYHIAQIAAWTPEEVAWADGNLVGFKGRVSRDDWVSQARALAAGEDTEFSKRVDKGDVY